MDKWKWTRTYFENNREYIFNRLIYTTITFFGDTKYLMRMFGKTSVAVPVQKYRFMWINLLIYKKNSGKIAESQMIDHFYLIWFMN